MVGHPQLDVYQIPGELNGLINAEGVPDVTSYVATVKARDSQLSGVSKLHFVRDISIAFLIIFAGTGIESILNWRTGICSFA